MNVGSQWYGGPDESPAWSAIVGLWNGIGTSGQIGARNIANFLWSIGNAAWSGVSGAASAAWQDVSLIVNNSQGHRLRQSQRWASATSRSG